MKFNPRHALAAAALVLLAACGGGGSQVDPFEPRRLIVFGDEHSMLTADGRNYSVNGLKLQAGQTVVDCEANPIWVQTLANGFGLVLAGCNTNSKVVNSLLYAQPGATVERVRAQIDQHFTGGGVNSRDLITVFAGAHDILELYAQFPAQTASQLKAQAGERGRQLAEQANRLARANGRVLVLTIPSIGLTPLAYIEKAARNDTDRQELLNELSAAFNRELRLTLINDGRLIGLVLADELADGFVKFPSGTGLADVRQAACAVAVPDCTVSTLVVNANAGTWMWADEIRFGPRLHAQIGTSALTRAARNPF